MNCRSVQLNIPITSPYCRCQRSSVAIFLQSLASSPVYFVRNTSNLIVSLIYASITIPMLVRQRLRLSFQRPYELLIFVYFLRRNLRFSTSTRWIQGGSSSSKYPYTGLTSSASPSSHASPSVFSSLGSEVCHPEISPEAL